MLLLDASVIVDLFIPPTDKTVARDQFGTGMFDLLVSDFAAGEFNSAVARLRRMGVIDNAKAQRLFMMFDAWREANTVSVITEPSDIRIAGGHVRLTDVTLRMPDAVHIATAQRLGAVLATFDVKQSAAARRLGLSVFDFGLESQC